MAEGGRIEPGRHAGTPASPTSETRRLVEDGGYAGRHETPGRAWKTLGSTGHACAPGRCNHPDSADYNPDYVPGQPRGGEGPEGD